MTSIEARSDEPSRVCIRAPNWVGDVVMATPALRAVRARFPSARITAVVHRRVAQVLQGAGWFDETVIYSPGERLAPIEFMRCVRRLRKPRQELGLVLPNSFSSALMLRLAAVGRRVGYARDMRSWLLTDAVPRPSEAGRFRPTYMVDYYLSLCEAAGVPAAGRHMELPFAPDDAERAESVLRGRDVDPAAALFLIHPGAGFGPAKRWPAERYARLAELLQGECGAQIAIVAGPSEAATAREIADRSQARIADLVDCGIDLHLLKCVVARSKLLVTTDSGPRHYGVALGVPTVCVMGPTHPGYSTGDRPNDVVVRLDVGCGPCQRRHCPRDHRCMEDITAEMVLAACRDALEPPAGGGGL